MRSTSIRWFPAAIVLTLACLTVSPALATLPQGWVDQQGRIWWTDEFGFDFFQVYADCRFQRVYRDPIRRAMLLETCNHLAKIGLPNPSGAYASPASAVPGDWGSPGYNYYETCFGELVCDPWQWLAVTDWTRRRLSCVNWPAAVEQATHNAVTRAFNSVSTIAVDDQALRPLVRDAVVRSLNYAGRVGAEGSLTYFQSLVQKGIEDAVVEAFNRVSVVTDRPGGTLEGPPMEVLPPGQPQMPPLLAPPAAEPLPNQTPAVGADSPPTPPTTPARPIALHDVAQATNRSAAPTPYTASRMVTAGWVVSTSGITPLVGGREFLVRTLRDDPQFVEIWHNQERLFGKCRYAAYYEDARLMEPTAGMTQQPGLNR